MGNGVKGSHTEQLKDFFTDIGGFVGHIVQGFTKKFNIFYKHIEKKRL